MLALVLSFAERVGPKVSLAGVLFIAAIVLPADAVGLYTWITLVYGLTQSVFDSAARQIAVEAYKYDFRFLRRYQLIYAVVAPLIVFSAILLLYASQGALALTMAPFVLAPIATAAATARTARLQLDGAWSVLARGQMYSAVVSLGLSIPLLLTTQQVGAAALHVLISELVNTAWVFAKTRGTKTPQSATVHASVSRSFAGASLYSTLSWGQTQGDRLLVGFVSGTVAIANYNFANSIARTGSLALGSSSSNVLRAKLVGAERSSHKRITEAVAIRSLLMATILSIMVTALAVLLLPHILDDSWAPAISIAPTIAAAGLVSVIGYLATVVLVAHRRIRRGVGTKVLGVALALPIALASLHSLELAAFLAWGREIIMSGMLLLSCGSYAPWKAYGLSVLASLPLVVAGIAI